MHIVGVPIKDKNKNGMSKQVGKSSIFNKLIKFITNKLFNKKDQDRYYDFLSDLYTHRVIDDDTFDNLKANYEKGKNSKKRDNYERYKNYSHWLEKLW